jgi:hypothetical protein
MPTRMLRTARPLAAALALGALITMGAACSSSSGKSASPSSSGGSAATPTSSAVGSSTSPATAAKSSGGDPNPCTIVTAAEVQAITGTAASPTGPTQQNRGSVCTWHPGNGTSLLVQVFHGKEFYAPSIQAPKATKLTGIGDDAYLDAFGTTRVGVGFLKGDVAVFLDGLSITSADAVVAAARDAASKV